jgi:ADP-L-glycero-D-manno-heptose 6-epimerase
MVLVTGGAGFIGSNLAVRLNEAGHGDVAVWRNLQKRRLADFVAPADLAGWLSGRKLEAVFHMGAISETTATDGDLVIDTNFRLPLSLLDWCAATRTPFIYASSAATYGDGEAGFADDNSLEALTRLKPMNLYGWSKHLFDLAVIERARNGASLPLQWAGLKFFNVFGPNEYHKGVMMSLVAKRFEDAKAGKAVRLFKSHRAGIADGERRRDFIYVDDTIAVMLWLIDHPPVSGIFNVGTGVAASFKDMITALLAAIGRGPNIEYIDMPLAIRNSYQYFTQASIDQLRQAGYSTPFTPIGRR